MRTEQTPESFDEVAADLLAISRRMTEIASDMRRAGVSVVQCHFSTVTTHLLPRLAETSHKLQGEVRGQIDTQLKGVKSQAEKEKEAYAKTRRRKNDDTKCPA